MPTKSIAAGSALLATLFLGLFLWSSHRRLDPASECVHIQLLDANETRILPNGFFDESGKECVYRSTLPEYCRSYYESVPGCPERRRLWDDTGNNWALG